MNTMMARLAIVACLAVLPAGCGGDVRSGMTGSWKGDRQDLVIYADGRIEMSDHRHGTYMGTWRLDGEDVLHMEFERFAYPVVREARIRGGELLLTDSNGIDEVYRR